jgi:hypothetical protein
MRGWPRIRRLAYRGRTSWPMLSGDAFARLADFRLERPLHTLSLERLRRLRSSEIIFCEGDYLNELLADSRRLATKALLVGNSDRDYFDVPAPLPVTLKVLLLQNSFVSDSRRVFTLPIGIENLALGQNGRLHLFPHATDEERQHRVLVGPFSSTHPVRSEITQSFHHAAGPWTIVDKRLDPRDLANAMRRHNWVLAPRGNGVDTHRTWEALYRGAIPIVEASAWSLSLGTFAFPLSLTKSFAPDDVQAVMAEWQGPLAPQIIRFLWMDSWESWLARMLSGDSRA